ncbi:hypothetical protein, partial [Streptomyces candidus]
TADTARHVLWGYGSEGGAEPGTFTKHVMAAISSADVANRAILSRAYPGLYMAIQIARSDPDGIAKLQRIAAGQTGPLSCHCGDFAGPFDLQGRCETCVEAAA